MLTSHQTHNNCPSSCAVMDDNTSTPVTPHIASACAWEGNPGDKYPPDGGSQQAKDVTDALESAGIPCCLVGVAALKYFGAGRISEASRFPSSSRFNFSCWLSARIGQFAFQQNYWALHQLFYNHYLLMNCAIPVIRILEVCIIHFPYSNSKEPLPGSS